MHCAAASCVNNSKYRDRLIVMPHVIELQFHKAHAEDYTKWEKKLDKTDYRVSQYTRICSNHFKYGKPLAGSSVPTLYMRSYPDWALSRKQAAKEVAAVENGLICHALVHVCKYLDPQTTTRLAEQLRVQPGKNSDCIFQKLLSMSSTEARQLLQQVAPIVPGGKCLEALHIYRYGALCEGTGWLSAQFQPPKVDSVCANKRKDCNPYSIPAFHSYAKPETFKQSTEMVHCGHQCNRKEGVAWRKHNNKKQRLTAVECKEEVLYENYFHGDSTLRETQNIQLSEKITEPESALKCTQQIMKGPKVSIESIKHSDELIQLHTGLPSYQYFKWIYKEVDKASENMKYWHGNGSEKAKKYIETNQKKPGPSRVVSKENELLITLMKLRLNMMEEYLAYLFNVKQPTVSSILSTWIPLLSHELSGLIYWPEVEEIKLCYPDCFKRWPGIRALLDCFEIPTQKPSHVEANTQVFSSYKNRATTKFCLACTPGGSISFISPPAGGNMSDKEIVIACNLPQKFSPGDKCMVDKGFHIKGELLEYGVELIHPPFVHRGQPFTEEKNRLSKQIAHARIHIERVIGRLRDYKYLSSEIPVSQLDLIGPAARVCCALTNLKSSVVGKS
ncbi:uncharacterized protein LOC119730420 [Patiria miniata]|uniref:THAP-type domain-containing protein n=1 Tax=Patiria miniata TaxID=46514 RepID=A0A914A658_PATMI|nr:uncharacterized protein LOC119730420 [Patiria miniata]